MCGPGFQAVQIGFNSMSQGGLLDLRKGLWLLMGECAERVAGTGNFRQSKCSFLLSTTGCFWDL